MKVKLFAFVLIEMLFKVFDVLFVLFGPRFLFVARLGVRVGLVVLGGENEVALLLDKVSLRIIECDSCQNFQVP